MRVCLLALLLGAAPLAGGALHRDAGVARSGCAVVLRTLSEMVAHPPAELASRRDGEGRPFTQTREFFDLSTRSLCGSALLARYRLHTSLFGERSWELDPLADYAPLGMLRTDPFLMQVCRRLVKHHAAALPTAVFQGSTPPEETCAALSGHELADSWRAHASRLAGDPLTLLKLLPIFIIAAAMPLLLKPMLDGPPAVPEPRGPLLEGEEGDEDAVGAGCLPSAGAGAGAGKRAERKGKGKGAARGGRSGEPEETARSKKGD